VFRAAYSSMPPLAVWQRPRKLTMEEKMMWHPSAYVMEYYRWVRMRAYVTP